jgi:hypothetical protein
MKRILYTSYNTWRKLEDEDKNKFYFIATSFTIPKYYIGYRYIKLVPSKELFFITHKEGYNPSIYYKRYLNEISKYNKKEIINEILSLSDKQIVLLGWEEYKVYGECQFLIEWIFNLEKNQSLEFALENNLYQELDFLNL